MEIDDETPDLFTVQEDESDIYSEFSDIDEHTLRELNQQNPQENQQENQNTAQQTPRTRRRKRRRIRTPAAQRGITITCWLSG